MVLNMESIDFAHTVLIPQNWHPLPGTFEQTIPVRPVDGKTKRVAVSLEAGMDSKQQGALVRYTMPMCCVVPCLSALTETPTINLPTVGEFNKRANPLLPVHY